MKLEQKWEKIKISGFQIEKPARRHKVLAEIVVALQESHWIVVAVRAERHRLLAVVHYWVVAGRLVALGLLVVVWLIQVSAGV